LSKPSACIACLIGTLALGNCGAAHLHVPGRRWTAGEGTLLINEHGVSGGAALRKAQLLLLPCPPRVRGGGIPLAVSTGQEPCRVLGYCKTLARVLGCCSAVLGGSVVQCFAGVALQHNFYQSAIISIIQSRRCKLQQLGLLHCHPCQKEA